MIHAASPNTNGHHANGAASCPPHSLEAERAIFGAMLLDQSRMALIARGIDPADFYADNHQSLFSVMLDRHRREKPTDTTLLVADLKERGLLSAIGGAAYLAELLTSCPSVANVPHYISVVKEKSALRRLLFLTTAIKAGIDRGAAADKLFEQIETGLADIAHQRAREDAELIFVRVSDVEAESIPWLWANRIPIGKLSLLVGDPGLGKSIASLDITARVTTGAPFPGETGHRAPGSVIILGHEDGIADTIRPRLDAARADTSKVTVLQSVKLFEGPDGKPAERQFLLSHDVPLLSDALDRTPDTKLVLLDPISAYYGKADSHNNAETRAVLAPLLELAAKHRVAILGISHLNKNSGSGRAMYRTMGSIGLVAVARTAWAIAADKDDPLRRLMLPIKNNLAADTLGLAYRIMSDESGRPCVTWEAGAVALMADDALEDDNHREERTERNEAADWLREALSAGPAKSKELLHDAKANGISEKTLRRAAKKLGASITKSSFSGGWYWELPTEVAQVGQPTCHTDSSGHLGHLGHLGSAQDSQDIPLSLEDSQDSQKSVPDGLANIDDEQGYRLYMES